MVRGIFQLEKQVAPLHSMHLAITEKPRTPNTALRTNLNTDKPISAAYHMEVKTDPFMTLCGMQNKSICNCRYRTVSTLAPSHTVSLL